MILSLLLSFDPFPTLLTAVLAYTTHCALSSRYVHTTGVAGSGLLCSRVDDALLDVGGEREESLFDVDVALGADLHEGNAKFVSQSLTLGCRDGALFFPIALVADQDFVDTFSRVLLDV